LQAEIQRILRIARTHPNLRNVRIVSDHLEEARISVPPDLFEQSLLNMLLNAGQVMPDGGTLEVRLSKGKSGGILEVHDSGPGIPPEQRKQIFQAGYSTKREGCGIGLLTVRAFVAAVNGSITVGESPLGGAVFTLTIPGI